MIFEFELNPIDEVQPWGEPPNQSLHWFGFTDGKYRLKVGSEYLLNYSEKYTKYLNEKFPKYISKTSFVEHQVVRLWEDILDLFPEILEPVPKDLQHFLNSDWEHFHSLSERVPDWQESEIEKGIKEDETWETIESTTYWLDNRRLDNGYLINRAGIWIWSDENNVIINWDNREVKVENIPVWSASYGTYRINKETFINEVRNFDNSLISQINARVETICQTWSKTDIKIDLEALKKEQINRATWLESALNIISKTDWNKVISAIKTINP